MLRITPVKTIRVLQPMAQYKWGTLIALAAAMHPGTLHTLAVVAARKTWLVLVVQDYFIVL
jgi:hypothetical protein